MIWLAIALAMFAAAFIGIAWARHRARREVLVVVPTDLAPRIVAATRALAGAEPWQPASQAGAPEAAAAIEAALIAGDRKRALELAEASLAAGSHAAPWLAWALVANAQPAAALHQLATGTRFANAPPAAPHEHATGTRVANASATTTDDGALVENAPSAATTGDETLAMYLHARAEHLQFELAAGASGAVPALITTADLAVVTLSSGRGAATWLKGTSDVELSAAQARAAIGEHRDITARCLARALDALEAAPGFADAAYLVARLAVKAGLLAEARALFDALAPRMTGRPDADAFERDRNDLADPASAVAAAKTAPPPSPVAKRSRSLKVL